MLALQVRGAGVQGQQGQAGAAMSSGAAFGTTLWTIRRLSWCSGLGLAAEQREGQTGCAIKPSCLWKCNRLIAFTTLLAGLLQCLCFGPALSLLAQHAP